MESIDKDTEMETIDCLPRANIQIRFRLASGINGILIYDSGTKDSWEKATLGRDGGLYI